MRLFIKFNLGSKLHLYFFKDSPFLVIFFQLKSDELGMSSRLLICVLMSLFLTGCFVSPGGSTGFKSVKDPISGQKSLELSNFQASAGTHSQLEVSFEFSGDSNQDSETKIFFCSIRLKAGCDPLVGHSVSLEKVSGKLSASISFSDYGITESDIIKYVIQRSDPDGVTGGEESGNILVPRDTGTVRKFSQLGFNSFGLNAGGEEFVTAAKFDSSGGVIIAGHTTSSLGEPNAGEEDVYVLKLTSSGSLDPNFNNGRVLQLGKLSIGDAANKAEYVKDLKIDSSGNIVITGVTTGSLGETNAGYSDMFIARFTATGSLDTTFSDDGILQFGSETIGSAASGYESTAFFEFDSSGNIYIAGSTSGAIGEASAGNADVLVYKITSEGVLDTSFSGDGIFQLGNISVGTGAIGNEDVTGLLITSSDDLVIAGNTTGSLGETNAGMHDVFIAKINSTGFLDTSFNGSGILQLGNLSVGAGASSYDISSSIAFDSNENILLGGSTTGTIGETNGALATDIFVAKITSSGSLDTSFGGDGIIQLGNVTIGSAAIGFEYIYDLKVDSSNKVLVTGVTQGSIGEASGGSYDALIVRLTTNGALDTSFSSDGMLQFGGVTIGAASYSADHATISLLDSSGNIFIAGHTIGSMGEVASGRFDLFLAKLNSSGALDTSFSDNGIFQLGKESIGAGNSGDEEIHSMDLDASGNIYLAGETSGFFGEESGGFDDVFVVKLTPGGVLDPSFSGDGILQLGKTTIGSGASDNDSVSAILIDSSGNIFIGGETRGALGETNAGESDVFVAKVTSAGVLDSSFGGSGVVQLGNSTLGVRASKSDYLTSMKFSSTGDIMIGGYTRSDLGETNANSSGSSSDVFVAKLTTNGTLDLSFNGDGIVQLGDTTIGTNANSIDYLNSMAIDASDNLYLGGNTYGSLGEANAGSADIFVIKLTSSGALDTSFSGDGIIQLGNVTIGAGASASEGLSEISLDSSDRPLLVGNTYGSLGEANAGGADIFISRLTSSGALDTSFSGDGIVQFGNVTLGSAANGNDFGVAIQFDASENIFLGGTTASSLGEPIGGDRDIFIMKLTSSGDLDNGFGTNGLIQFGTTTMGSKADGDDYLMEMRTVSSGNIVFSGFTTGSLAEAHAGGFDIFVSIMSATGNFD